MSSLVTMNIISADKDSLVALDALLRIKSSGSVSPAKMKEGGRTNTAPKIEKPMNEKAEKAEIQTATSPRSFVAQTSNTKPSSTKKSSVPSSSRQSNTGQHAVHQNAGSMLLPQLKGSNNCTAAHLVAMQQAAGAAAAAAAAHAFGSSFTSNNNNTGGGANFHHHHAAAAAAAAQAHHHLLARQQSGQQRLSPAPIAAATAAATAEEKPLNESNAPSNGSAGSVRKEKVEAALRSKPQRGRKREDLSEKERLELTRTRNREHAKSTRIRKKARYQELLDCEQKLKELEKAEGLRRKRSDSILKFLDIRQRMVNNAAVATPKRSDDADHHDGSSRNSSAIYNVFVNTLDEVVCSISNFQYESICANTVVDRRSNGRTESNGSSSNSSSDLECMKDWDVDFVKRVTQCYGPGAERFVEFKAVGGADGIALSKDGSGFTHVEIVLNINESRLLVTATLSFQFAPESDQIRSASWTTVHEYCAPQQRCRGNNSNRNLQQQNVEDQQRSRLSPGQNLCDHFVFPSVVSLDAEKSHDDDENTGTNAPGMSI